jgi:hypothetical protein
VEALNTLYNLMGLIFAQTSSFSLLALMVLMVVLNFSNAIGLLGSGGLLASLNLVILTVVGGYLLGSLGKVGSWLQALGAGQRNIAVARAKRAKKKKEDEAKSRQQKVRSRRVHVPLSNAGSD